MTEYIIEGQRDTMAIEALATLKDAVHTIETNWPGDIHSTRHIYLNQQLKCANELAEIGQQLCDVFGAMVEGLTLDHERELLNIQREGLLEGTPPPVV